MTSTHMTWNKPTLADRQRFPPQAIFEAGLRNHHIANTAYPIHHTTTVRPYRVPRQQVLETIQAAWQDTECLGLYVHVPFCAVRCRYCEYTVVAESKPDVQSAYFERLLREFELYREALDTTRKTLIGFDIGGGTPSFVDPALIEQVVLAARRNFRWDPAMALSIETTPIIADREPDKIAAYKEMGIDRISMGVQTTHFKLAHSLGREYNGLSMLESAVRHIRDAGFERFNIDLMYGFAEQSPESWRNTLAQTIDLGPEYITLYQMRFKGTQMSNDAARVSLEQTHALKVMARKTLLKAGYAGTPGKNTFSRVPGDVGTSEYLTERVVKGTSYLGLGLGAQSFSPYTLSYNQGAASKTLKPYLKAIDHGHLPVQDLYHLPRSSAMAKMIAVSFYFGEIHRTHFSQKFGIALEEQFGPQVAWLKKEGLMHDVGPYLRLTEKGEHYFNGIVALFYAGAVQDYLQSLNKKVERPTAHIVRPTPQPVLAG